MNSGPAAQGDGNQQLAFEAFSLSGNSGSPVFVPQRGVPPGGVITMGGPYHPLMLVGINAGHMPHRGEHSGLSYMYKSTAILELIGQLEA